MFDYVSWSGDSVEADDVLQGLCSGRVAYVIFPFDGVSFDLEAISRRLPEMLKSVAQQDANRSLDEISIRETYFGTASDTERLYMDHLGAIDARQRMRDLMSLLLGGRVVGAADPCTGRKYLAGEYRRHGAGQGVTLHRDNARADAPSFSVADLEMQLSVVLVLRNSASGGVLRLYRRPWEVSDNTWRRRDRFDFDPAVVTEMTQIDVPVRNGDMYVFNSNNFHEVSAACGDNERYSCGFFVGRNARTNIYETWA